ncbi:MAG TPA: hypothetical protein VHC92_05095 [Rhodanobacteraceae bacterium]|jgi:hypothetical protein|nr:hypothetical protein [Rhodanobacteraceae bacterium]
MSQIRPDIIKRLAAVEIQHAPAPAAVPLVLGSHAGETEGQARQRLGYSAETRIIFCHVVDARKKAA